MIPFYIVCGFLGSGKTALVGEMLATYSEQYRIAVIQNEFAPNGIDGQDLKRRGHDFHLTEINNGSVFCVCQLSNFIEMLQKLVRGHKPDMILLEPSGLSDPVNVIELLQVPGIRDKVGLARIFTLVDAPNYDKGLKTLPRFRHQIMIADTLIVNKTDQYSGDPKVFNAKLNQLNPFAKILYTSYCNIPMDEILNNKDDHKAARRYLGQGSGGRPEIHSVVLRTHQTIDKKKLGFFMDRLSRVSIRFKGFIKLEGGNHAAIQGVYGDNHYEIIQNYTGPGEIIAFGEGLTVGVVKDIFDNEEISPP